MYKLYINASNQTAIMKIDNGVVTSFTFDPDNTDYQEYLTWLAEGNTPEPADEASDEPSAV